MTRAKSPPPRERPRRAPEGGHATLGFAIGVDVAVQLALVIYDDAVDLVVPGLAAPILLGEHELLRFEKLLRQARRMMPLPQIEPGEI